MTAGRTRAVLWAATGALACGVAGGAQAQIAPLVAPGTQTATTLVPDVVLRRADWIVYEPQNVEELLRWAAGVVVVRNGGAESLEYLGLLGSTSGRVQMVLDGLDVTDAESGLPRLFAIPLGMLDRVEIFRSTEPARIAFYLRESADPQPVADFDLTRGDFGKRTRRVQFFTPERRLTLGVSYDEALQEAQDFRSDPSVEAPLELGAADDRALTVRVDMQRGPDRVRLTHWRAKANSHGTLFAAEDEMSVGAVRTRLRWERPWARVRSVLEVANQAWDEHRFLSGDERNLRSARTTLGLDVGADAGAPGTWSAWVRARGEEASADGTALDGGTVARRVRTERAELEVARTGRLRLAAAGGAQHDPRAGTLFTGSGSIGLGGEVWSLVARGGHGVEFVGLSRADSVQRRGDHAVLELVRRTPTLEVRAQGFAKRFDDRVTAGDAGWDLGGLGLQRLAGGGLEIRWVLAGKRWLGGAQTSATYIPHRNGDPAGLPLAQARVHARAGARLFNDDLIIQATTDWAFDSERRYGNGPALGSTAIGDAMLDTQILQRLHLYFGTYNVGGVRVPVIPGVLRAERSTIGGVRVQLLD